MWDTEDMVLGKQGPTPPMPSSTRFAEIFAFMRPWKGGGGVTSSPSPQFYQKGEVPHLRLLAGF